MFSQEFDSLSTGGTPVPVPFSGLFSQVLSGEVSQSQVLSQVSGPRSFLGCTRVPVPFPDL